MEHDTEKGTRDEKDPRVLLERAGCPPNVVRHSEAVAALAGAIASRIPGCDLELVRKGALLHDIGRSITHGIRHAYEGALLARRMGVEEEVCEIIRTHVGGGITAPEAAAMGLPREDFVPRTLEAKVVAHADNLIADTVRRRLADAVNAYLERGLRRAAERIGKLHEELSSRAGIDIDEIGRD